MGCRISVAFWDSVSDQPKGGQVQSARNWQNWNTHTQKSGGNGCVTTGVTEMKRKEAIVIVWLLLALNNKVKGTWSQFYHLRGRLIFQEEFDFLNTSRWQHIITAWRGGNNEFEYYTDRPENRYNIFHQFLTALIRSTLYANFCFQSYVRDGVLHIRPTLTADRFGQDFLYNGTLDLWPEGCNVNYNGGCVAYVHTFFENILFILFSKHYSCARLYIRFFLHRQSTIDHQNVRRRHHQSHSVGPDAHD